MQCKKDINKKKCLCLKRYKGGCAACEKNAMQVVKESGRDLNEAVTDAKENPENIPKDVAFRSSIDILRGVCLYCKLYATEACDECMLVNKPDGKDYWTFDEHLV